MHNTYMTVQGDTFDSIAFKFYGNEKLFNYLLEANPKYINTVVFSANVELKIPTLDVSIMSTNDNLPVWRK